jgi:hypothetical protein
MQIQPISNIGDYYLLRVESATTRPYYVIGRNGKIITKSYAQKRNALKALKLIATSSAPIISERLWLSKFGPCSQ